MKITYPKTSGTIYYKYLRWECVTVCFKYVKCHCDQGMDCTVKLKETFHTEQDDVMFVIGIGKFIITYDLCVRRDSDEIADVEDGTYIEKRTISVGLKELVKVEDLWLLLQLMSKI